MFIKKGYLIFIGILFLVLTSLLLGKFFWEDKPEKIKKEAKELKTSQAEIKEKKPIETDLNFHGKIVPAESRMIVFDVSGTLEKGDVDLKQGVSFKSNKLLYKLNLKEAFYAISSKKIALAEKITASLNDLPAEISTEKDKWEKFVSNVIPAKRLPALPTFTSKKELGYFSEKGILVDYNALAKMELEIEKYFYLAPFDGYVDEVYVKPGSTVKSGKSIARISKRNSFELKVTVPQDQSELFEIGQKVDLLNIEKDTIGGGKLIRKSDNKDSSSSRVDLYFSVRANKGERISNGMELQLTIDN